MSDTQNTGEKSEPVNPLEARVQELLAQVEALQADKATLSSQAEQLAGGKAVFQNKITELEAALESAASLKAELVAGARAAATRIEELQAALDEQGLRLADSQNVKAATQLVAVIATQAAQITQLQRVVFTYNSDNSLLATIHKDALGAVSARLSQPLASEGYNYHAAEAARAELLQTVNATQDAATITAAVLKFAGTFFLA